MNRLAIPAILFLLCVSVMAGRPPGQRHGSITGRLTNESGHPISNAGVFIRRLGSQTPVSRSTGTDEDGRFHIDDLAPGSYTIIATTPGYVPAVEPDEEPRYRVGDSVTLRFTKGGVITGTITNSLGEPVIGVRVTAIRVRDGLGRQVRQATPGSARQTDDRGVYRLFGLSSGSYVVLAGGASPNSFYGSAFDGDASTFYPSTTRDAAAEVQVRTGEEMSGIDIRYRGDQGYSVSGTLSGAVLASTNSQAATVYLRHAASGSVTATVYVSLREGTRGFALSGVPDGEYELIAQLGPTPADDPAASLPRRVTVKGADVTGISLELALLGSISGRVVVEKLAEAGAAADCKDRVVGSLDETLISARRDEPPGKVVTSSLPQPDGAAERNGDFKISNLTPARYRLETRLPSDWYVRSIVASAPGATKQITALSNQGISITSGQRVAGVIVTVSEGAAALRGKVTPPQGNEPLPERLRVYLVPAEPESAEELLKYVETVVEGNGTFSLPNLAPGKYYVLAREPLGEQLTERNARPVSWDAAARGKLRQQARSSGQVVELGRCQRVAEYILKYSPVSDGVQPPRRVN
jgi:hypothetical protein